VKGSLILLLVLWCIPLGIAGEPRFRKLEIESPRFTQDQVGVLHLELEKVANFLSIYVYQTYAKEIAEGRAESRLRARRWLSLALHVDPHNVAAQRINEMLAAGVAEPLESDLPQMPKLFVGEVLRLIKLLQVRSEANAGRLAGFLALVAADLDPQNEDAVYAAEIFIQKERDVSAAWKALALGSAPAK
jgi:hypothetical protein